MHHEIPFKLENFINGQFVPPTSNTYIPSFNPATGEHINDIPNSDETDIEAAVLAASNAFQQWSNLPSESRFKILNRIAEQIQDNLDFLALAETNDNGKPLWLSRQVDIPRASANFRFFATASMQFASESHQMENKSINYTLRQPIGIVGCISPWNLPLYLFTWKIAPALAAGNCVIAKPSEITPLTAYLLGQICNESGLPPGVLNIIHGIGPVCGEAIVKHPQIKAISFTGSTRAGRQIASIASPMFKKISLELGGKNPNLIFADCDWENMMKSTLRSSFSNQGQICLCGSRILIEETIYEKFKTEFLERVKQLSIGDPLQNDTRIGAIASELQFKKVMNCISIAREEGGKILAGGNAIIPEGRCAKGYFIEPTVIEGLGPSCRTNMEEIFGPVVTLQPFKNLEEAILLANTSEYGLACSIFTQNISKANIIAAQIQAGIVWINCWLHRDLRTPFGGMANSGVGREGGWEAMRFFTEPKNICIAYNN